MSRGAARSDGGFALLLAAGAVVVLGAAAAVGERAVERAVDDSSRRIVSTDRVDRIDAALKRFVARNRRLPCPAWGTAALTAPQGAEEQVAAGGDSCEHAPVAGAEAGVVPWRTLGLAPEDALDRWGRRLSYRVYDAPMGDMTASPVDPAFADGEGMPDLSGCADRLLGDPSAPCDLPQALYDTLLADVFADVDARLQAELEGRDRDDYLRGEVERGRQDDDGGEEGDPGDEEASLEKERLLGREPSKRLARDDDDDDRDDDEDDRDDDDDDDEDEDDEDDDDEDRDNDEDDDEDDGDGDGDGDDDRDDGDQDGGDESGDDGDGDDASDVDLTGVFEDAFASHFDRIVRDPANQAAIFGDAYEVERGADRRGAVYVVISHGDNGKGAWLHSGARFVATVSADEIENADAGDTLFRDSPYADPGADEFDDLLDDATFMETFGRLFDAALAGGPTSPSDEDVACALLGQDCPEEEDDDPGEVVASDGVVIDGDRILGDFGTPAANPVSEDYAFVGNPSYFVEVDLGYGNDWFGVSGCTETGVDLVAWAPGGSPPFPYDQPIYWSVEALVGGCGDDRLITSSQNKGLGIGGAGDDVIENGVVWRGLSRVRNEQYYLHGGSGDDIVTIGTPANASGRNNDRFELDDVLLAEIRKADTYGPDNPLVGFPGTWDGGWHYKGGAFGGSGTDRLVVRGDTNRDGAADFDLATLTGDSGDWGLGGFEIVDLTPEGDQTLALTPQAVFDMADAADKGAPSLLVVWHRDDDDVVSLSDGFVQTNGSAVNQRWSATYAPPGGDPVSVDVLVRRINHRTDIWADEAGS